MNNINYFNIATNKGTANPINLNKVGALSF